MELEEALEQAEVQEEEEELFVIDSELRTITIPSNIQNVGVESDSDVRRLCFQMPKQYGEVDLSAFDVRVNYLNANKEGDVYVVTDKEVSGDHMTFSWLLSRNAMAYKGTIRFIVCLKKTDDEGVTQQEFNTTIAQLTVLEGLETTEKMIQENKDLIEAILKQLDDVSGAEAKRQQAETERASAEAKRQQAETERASAESERQKQEQERQQAIVQVTNTANEAQNTANEAKEAAEAALNELNSKTQGNLLYRMNYASNVNVADFINARIENGIYSGYILFTNSTQLPGTNNSGIVFFYSPHGTSIVYLEYKLQDARYYGYFEKTKNTITWKQYSFL